MFSCCFLSFLFVVISVILTLLMVRPFRTPHTHTHIHLHCIPQWVRPPDINLNGVTMPTNALQVNAANQSLNINFDLAIRYAPRDAQIDDVGPNASVTARLIRIGSPPSSRRFPPCK